MLAFLPLKGVGNVPFYLRKSVSAGPFRFNLSKKGVGLSVGMRGLRVGVGPKGHYIHAGRGGVYYRSSIGRAGTKPKTSSNFVNNVHPFQELQPRGHGDVFMEEIESGSALEMTDSNYEGILSEINSIKSKAKLSTLFGIFSFFAATSISLVYGASAVWVFIICIPAILFGGWLDNYKRSSVLFFNLEPEIERAYQALAEIIDRITQCKKIWHVGSKGEISDLTNWKRNAGASALITRAPTSFSYKLPAVIKSNIVPPTLKVGKQTLYFFPDTILVEDNKEFGAVPYRALEIEHYLGRFIEDEKVPADAMIVDHTWLHPNKSGGPDRRFANNRQIPVCAYDYLHLRSPSGLNELVKFSKPDAAGFLARFLEIYPKTLRR